MSYQKFYNKLKGKNTFRPIRLSVKQEQELLEKQRKREKHRLEDEAARRRKLEKSQGEKMPVCGPEYYGKKELKKLCELINDDNCVVVTHSALEERVRIGGRVVVHVLCPLPKKQLRKRKAVAVA